MPKPEETPGLLAMGARLRELREGVGLTRAEVAERAAVNTAHLWRLEAAQRRPRRSTLMRIVAVLCARDPGLDPDAILRELVDLAGVGLAPESAYAGRLIRRAERRARKLENRARHRWPAEFDGGDPEPYRLKAAAIEAALRDAA